MEDDWSQAESPAIIDPSITVNWATWWTCSREVAANVLCAPGFDDQYQYRYFFCTCTVSCIYTLHSNLGLDRLMANYRKFHPFPSHVCYKPHWSRGRSAIRKLCCASPAVWWLCSCAVQVQSLWQRQCTGWLRMWDLSTVTVISDTDLYNPIVVLWSLASLNQTCRIVGYELINRSPLFPLTRCRGCGWTLQDRQQSRRTWLGCPSRPRTIFLVAAVRRFVRKGVATRFNSSMAMTRASSR